LYSWGLKTNNHHWGPTPSGLCLSYHWLRAMLGGYPAFQKIWEVTTISWLDKDIYIYTMKLQCVTRNLSSKSSIQWLSQESNRFFFSIQSPFCGRSSNVAMEHPPEIWGDFRKGVSQPRLIYHKIPFLHLSDINNQQSTINITCTLW
jgi:hypothetical protein